MIIPIDETWPEATLPLPFIDFSGGSRNATLSTPTEESVLARRSRFTKAYATAKISWKLTPTQKGVFISFFTDNLDNGAASFSIPLRYPKNSAITDWIVRFVTGLEMQYMEGIWDISSEIILLNKLASTDEDSAFGSGQSGDSSGGS